jgi:hypothetical protein
MQLIHRGRHKNKRARMVSAVGITKQGFAPRVR